MPIKPEQIDPTKLPVALRGYDRDVVDELLKRVAWDYRQALRAQEERADNDKRLEQRIEELEARLESKQAEFAHAIAGREARTDARTRTGASPASRTRSTCSGGSCGARIAAPN